MDIAVVHILRFEQGKIVEMWDVSQQVPKDSPNKLGMF
jgi:predicted SnoaL-like aldol condensation-catalyzing enzyme